MSNESIIELVKRTAQIAEVVEWFDIKLDRTDKALCPFHSEKTPSFSVNRKGNYFKCFGCGASGDAIDFVAKRRGITVLEAARVLAEMYGIAKPSRGCSKPKIPNATEVSAPHANGDGITQITAAQKARNADYIRRCITDVGKTDYFKKRGFSDDAIKKYFLGYDVEQDGIVIPYSSKLEYHITRLLHAPDPKKPYRKPPTEDWGAEPIYNLQAINRSGVVCVVESQICAVSIMQVGGVAVALGGTGGVRNFLKEVEAKKTKCIFVLALDNDAPGEKAQHDLADALTDAGVKFITYNLAENCKDPNELLMTDAQKLTANVCEAIGVAKRKFSCLKELFSAAELQTQDLKDIRWIVRDLLPEGLAIICAPSKYGKSWLMMQLCLAVATGTPFLGKKTEQCDCMYFALEDSKRRYKLRLNKLLDGAKAPSNFYGSVVCDSMSGGLFGRQKPDGLARHECGNQGKDI
ncbi:MAG: CHC2 zinc finger domain-containing protein [Firmicutes bacterium]|nr:CHC2 zinc finger domain-containing protein [Bacillota bacterium]